MHKRTNMLGRVNLKDKTTYMSNPCPRGFTKVSVPEGKSGDWEVKRFTPGRDLGLHNLMLIRDGYPERVLPPGTYTRLTYNGHVVMSDTPAEAHEHFDALCNAKGDVLIFGLGLGFFLKALLAKTEEVKSITVVEKSSDVLKLVAPSFRGQRVNFVEGDAWTWEAPKGMSFDYCWLDIWSTICEDNKADMKRLKRRYRTTCRQQECWSEQYL